MQGLDQRQACAPGSVMPGRTIQKSHEWFDVGLLASDGEGVQAIFRTRARLLKKPMNAVWGSCLFQAKISPSCVSAGTSSLNLIEEPCFKKA